MSNIYLRSQLSRSSVKCQTNDRRYGDEWQWNPGYGTGLNGESENGSLRIKKKAVELQAVNQERLSALAPQQTIVQLCQWEDLEAEADEMWSYVQRKTEQRWLWHAIEHRTGKSWLMFWLTTKMPHLSN
jgi:hypothetical protein